MLNVAEAYTNETDYTVWSDLSLSLGTQGLLIQHTDAAEEMKAYNRNLYSTVFQKVGWEAKDDEGNCRKYDAEGFVKIKLYVNLVISIL